MGGSMTDTLEEVSYEQFVKFNEECYGTSEYALPNARELATWNACLSRMTPIIEQRVRERLAKDYVYLPRIPTAEILSIVAFPMYPEDHDSGVLLRHELGLSCDVIFPKYETETAAGQYKRLVDLLDEILVGKLAD